MAKQQAYTTANRLLNLYRQEHVILGGWATINPVFISEFSDMVETELLKLPNGENLINHIKNLKSGATPMDSIASDLMPYGGLMREKLKTEKFNDAQISEISNALNNFDGNRESLGKIFNLNIVKQFGGEWATGVKMALAGHTDLLQKWETVINTERAHRFWKTANDILSSPISERVRAIVQADLPEYETYLPLFGDAGRDLLRRLRAFID